MDNGTKKKKNKRHMVNNSNPKSKPKHVQSPLQNSPPQNSPPPNSPPPPPPPKPELKRQPDPFLKQASFVPASLEEASLEEASFVPASLGPASLGPASLEEASLGPASLGQSSFGPASFVPVKVTLVSGTPLQDRTREFINSKQLKDAVEQISPLSVEDEDEDRNLDPVKFRVGAEILKIPETTMNSEKAAEEPPGALPISRIISSSSHPNAPRLLNLHEMVHIFPGLPPETQQLVRVLTLDYYLRNPRLIFACKQLQIKTLCYPLMSQFPGMTLSEIWRGCIDYGNFGGFSLEQFFKWNNIRGTASSTPLERYDVPRGGLPPGTCLVIPMGLVTGEHINHYFLFCIEIDEEGFPNCSIFSAYGSDYVKIPGIKIHVDIVEFNNFIAAVNERPLPRSTHNQDIVNRFIMNYFLDGFTGEHVLHYLEYEGDSNYRECGNNADYEPYYVPNTRPNQRPDYGIYSRNQVYSVLSFKRREIKECYYGDFHVYSFDSLTSEIDAAAQRMAAAPTMSAGRGKPRKKRTKKLRKYKSKRLRLKLKSSALSKRVRK